MSARAVVLAYHDVGVRCLSALLAGGVDVRLVVTHRDSPTETIWFGSVAQLAAEAGIPCVYAEDLDAAGLHARIADAVPDFLFSFYFRHMLSEDVLGLAPRGALNMHGSLLPMYRGRVPVNWAVIRGENETGASLHYMAAKPDAGDLVDQMAVPILPDDTAHDVFRKVTVAAECVLHRALPGLIEGTSPRRSLDLAAGSYFGGRKPEDGRIDWTRPSREVHNLVRGVAPPYPGAFTLLEGRRARVLRTCHRSRPCDVPPGTLFEMGGSLWAACGDAAALPVLSLEVEDHPVDSATFLRRFGPRAVAT